MPTYIAVCCYQCKMFQGQQENKQKKFKCKVCGAKQSFRHIFAKSDYPKDIRGVVQELNKKRMEEGATFNNTCETVWDTEKEDLIPPKSTENEEGSKWAAFVDSAVDQETTEADDPRFVTDSSVLVSESRTRKRNEQRGGRFQREKKERRIQKEREEPKEGETSLSVYQAAYTNVKLDISLMDVGNQRRTETNKSIELKHTASISREEECYVTDLDAPDDKEEKFLPSATVSSNSKWS
ncbi:hypothetical protein WA588_000563, partial [Blastocystis sp. NMH]